MFYIFLIDWCCLTAIEDKNFCGFNKITIQFLDIHEFTCGWFVEKKQL